ncbi:hypothetical protein [Lignipirellula cremea]|uniref:Uncharacterized protein n=1 Tax=Lignipirellula cremea TaxID=2528010 RepID=A0A518E1S4_9BACT|nr:hypothetical protein [Lignipirellula cremea]QDU98021.1 hypothetical protein Pla8534_58820 [Lignipirellula cremea]
MPVSSSPRPPADSPPDFGAIARTWSSLASNLLASGLVIVIALTIGRQVWLWRLAGPKAAALAAADKIDRHWANDRVPHRLQFGDASPALTRVVVDGDVDQALKQLHGYCRRIAQQSPAPLGSPGAGELRLLRQLEGTPAVDQSPGEWALYQLREPVVMAAAVRRADPHAAPPGVAAEPAVDRIVALGVALPVLADTARDPVQWTLHVMDVSQAPLAGPALRLDWPDFMGPVAAMESAFGQAIVARQGAGPLPRWQTFFDEALPALGYQRLAEWTVLPHGRQTRYLHPGERPLQVSLTESGDEVQAVLFTEGPSASAARDP